MSTGKMKKIISLVIAMAMVLSLCCISVSAASDLPAANWATGAGGVKGATGSSPWTRTHGGSNDQSRTSALMTMGSGSLSAETQLINGYNFTAVEGFKYVHTTFRVNCTNSWQIRLRGSDGNKQYMNFNIDGSVTGVGGSKIDYGATWNISEIDGERNDNTIDIVLNLTNKAAYCFVNKHIASYSWNVYDDGTWRGYSLYTLGYGDWGEGDNLQWKYNGDKNVGWKKYVDTEDYTVNVEDVFWQNDLETYFVSDHGYELFENDDIEDYVSFPGGNVPTMTYDGADKVTVEHDYYDPRDGYVQASVYFFSGKGFGSETGMAGDLIYMSYTQEINNAQRVEMRINAGGANQNGNRCTFTNVDGKIHVNNFNGDGKTYAENWDDPMDIGILIDKSRHKAYTFIDGTQLGNPWDFTSAGAFGSLRLYLNGTEEDSVANITLSNWKVKQYYSDKDRKDIIAQIEGMPVYFSETGNALETEGDEFGMSVTAKKTRGADDADEGTKLYAAVYDEDGKLTALDVWDYSDGALNDEIVFNYSGIENKVKVFCFTAGQKGLATPEVYRLSNYFGE